MISPITSSTLFQIDNDITTAVPMGSFEDKVKQLFAEYTVAVGSEKADLINKANNIDVSNPAELLKIQNQVGNYNLAMSTISTLTHKSVSAIDVILKAQ